MTTTTGLARLREPFPPSEINQLPRNVRKNDNERFKCESSNGRKVSMDGKYCGGFHSLAIHLDYVGHAALTSRLLEVDPEWTWEPMAVGPDGLPVFDRDGGLWIRLSICGVTRLGYGDAQGKSGANAVKEAIGDALRNAGMRFGAALDLWHKGDLLTAGDEQGREPAAEDAGSAALHARKQAAAQGGPPAWGPQQNQQLETQIYEAKGSVDILRSLWTKCQGMGAPQEVLDRIANINKPQTENKEQAV